MFDRRLSDDLAVVQDITKLAVAQAHIPGLNASSGNAAGAYSALQTELLTTVGISAGTDANGDTRFPFLLDIDAADSSEARL